MRNKNINIHVQELKYRVIYILFTQIINMIICFWHKKVLLNFVGLQLIGQTFVFTNITEGFLSYIYLSLIFGGVIFTIPVILYHIYMFILPGVYYKDFIEIKKFMYIYSIVYSVVLLILIKIIIPNLIKFFIGYQTDKLLIFMPKFLEYIYFLINIIMYIILCSIVPILVLFIHKIFNNKNLFVHNRPIIYMCILLLAAVVSPADFISFMLFTLPLVMLFEFSMFIIL